MITKVLSVAIIIFVDSVTILIPQAPAKVLFYCSLENEADVKAKGGAFEGGSFEPAKVGNGYLADEVGEVIVFL